MPERSTLRFVVGILDSWPQLRGALADMRVRGRVLDSFNCLAFERVFDGKIIVGPDHESVAIQAMPFPESPERIACTVGPLSDRLRERVRSDARTLKDALNCWLLRRHAVQFENAVCARKILFWIRVADADEECRAHHSLLAHSSHSVGIHDLALPDE